MTGKNIRVPELDGLRGIAILMVLLFHYINNPLARNISGNICIKLLKYITYFGWVGVDLFFVLSGFLIGGILLQNRNSSNYFKTFYIRRVLRIIPVYFLLLLIFYILNLFIGNSSYYTFEKPLPFWSYFVFIQNLFMGLQGHFGSEGITPTWSLAIEEQFYLICPLIIWAINRKYLTLVFILMIVASPVFRHFSSNWYQSYTWFTSRMDSLSFGVLCSLAYQSNNVKKFIESFKKAINAFTMLLFLVIIIFEIIFGSLGVIKHTLFAMFFSLLILIPLSQQGSIVAKMLRYKWLGKLGLISYSLYLFHNLINGVFHQVFLKNQKPLLNNMNDLYISLAAMVSSLLLASLLYIFIEAPAMRFGRTFKY